MSGWIIAYGAGLALYVVYAGVLLRDEQVDPIKLIAPAIAWPIVTLFTISGVLADAAIALYRRFHP